MSDLQQQKKMATTLLGLGFTLAQTADHLTAQFGLRALKVGGTSRTFRVKDQTIERLDERTDGSYTRRYTIA